MAVRRNRSMMIAALAGALLAGILAVGCARQSTGRPQASTAACDRSIAALIRHGAAIRSLPAACQGLTRAQVDAAVTSAIDTADAAMRGKRLMRARLRALRPLLPPPSHGAPAGSGQPGGQPAFGLAALAAWLITVALGCVLMARWITRGGLRRGLAGRAGARPVMNFAHLGFAVAGLAAWIAHLATGSTILAWTASLITLPVTGLGMSVLVVRPERARVREPVPAGHAAAVAAAPEPDPVGLQTTPARRATTLVVAAHIAFAIATLTLTLMATISSG